MRFRLHPCLVPPICQKHLLVYSLMQYWFFLWIFSVMVSVSLPLTPVWSSFKNRPLCQIKSGFFKSVKLQYFHYFCMRLWRSGEYTIAVVCCFVFRDAFTSQNEFWCHFLQLFCHVAQITFISHLFKMFIYTLYAHVQFTLLFSYSGLMIILSNFVLTQVLMN